MGNQLTRSSVGQTELLRPSKLGITIGATDFSNNLRFVRASASQLVTDQYTMIYAKKKQISYKANKRTIRYQHQSGAFLELIFQVSDDGVAFRYAVPGKNNQY